jgi:AcrR family transcriptional regulator
MTETADIATLPVRDRLLATAARLLEEHNGREVSTREICEAAAVQAPTLYHHFGSKQNLLDQVVSHGFRQFLASRPEMLEDPIERIRHAWDVHVAFGVEHPSFYGLIYARVIPGKPCAVVAEVEAFIRRALEPLAAEGRLAIPADTAAAAILASSSGVVLRLITDPTGPDWTLSARVRDAVLRDVVGDDAASHGSHVETAALRLSAALGSGDPRMTIEETALLRTWLARLARGDAQGPGKVVR